MESMIDQKVYPHPQLPPPQQMHPNLMNQRPPNHQMMPHPPPQPQPHPHSHPQYQQQQTQQPQMQHQQAPHSIRPNMIRMQNTMPMQPMHQPSGPVNTKPNIHNSMPFNVPYNNNGSNNNGSNNTTSNNNNDSTTSGAAASAAVASNSNGFANGSHGSNNQANNSWKQEQPHCSGCKKPIYERHLLKAVDQLWHEDCLKCDACHARLGEVGNTLYIKANKLLCRSDYYRMFGTPGICSACSQKILPYEMVMKAKSNNYHMNCFACHRCQHRFCVGDRFFLLDNRVLCENDCENRSAVDPQNVNMRTINRTSPANQGQSKQKMTNSRAGH